MVVPFVALCENGRGGVVLVGTGKMRGISHTNLFVPLSGLAEELLCANDHCGARQGAAKVSQVRQPQGSAENRACWCYYLEEELTHSYDALLHKGNRMPRRAHGAC